MVDPTENVKDLSEASNRRQDDLRSAQDKLTDEKIRHVATIVELEAKHAREIREAESSRLDAIRLGWEKLLGFVGLLGGLIGLFAYFSK